MTLVTADNLTKEAGIRGINISNYDASGLTNLSTYVQTKLETVTRRFYESHTETESEYYPITDPSPSQIQLKYYPVTSITSFKIGDNTVPETDYFLKNDIGVIIFKYGYPWIEEYEVQYTTVSNDNYITMAEGLITDLCMAKLKNPEFPVDSLLSEMKEGDIMVKYRNISEGSFFDFNLRIQELTRPRMQVLMV